MTAKNKITLEITSWSGLCADASHYYGKFTGYIDGQYFEHQIRYTLTESRAQELNALHRKNYPGDKLAPYRAGGTSIQFDTPDDVISFARSDARKRFKNYRLVVEHKY